MKIKSTSLFLLMSIIFACGKKSSKSFSEEKSDSSKTRADSLDITLDSIFDPFYGEDRVLMSNIYKVNIDTLKLIIKEYKQNTKFDLWAKNHDAEYNNVIRSISVKYNIAPETISKIIFTIKYNRLIDSGKSDSK